MISVFVQLASWDNPYEFSRARGGKPLSKNDFVVGDQVIIKNDLGADLGRVIKIEEKASIDYEAETEEEKRFILRKAAPDDIQKWGKKNQNKNEIIKKCEFFIKTGKLPMKIVDAFFSFDGSKIVFAFTAPNRVDFRGLVKDLVQEFHKSIRMHQVGARQETGLSGDVGSCGLPLCCLSFHKKLGHVTAEMMTSQQLSQRGPERLSGICGHLKCCLSFEYETYKELIKKFPPVGTEVKIKSGKGKVVDWQILKQKVVVEISNSNNEKSKIEVPIEEIKK